jgi:glycosyltransferase involved in cell wall biosynthesis
VGGEQTSAWYSAVSQKKRNPESDKKGYKIANDQDESFFFTKVFHGNIPDYSKELIKSLEVMVFLWYDSVMSERPKKKVLFCITKSNFGGAQRYVYDLATSMPAEQFDVAVVFGGGGELGKKLDNAGVRTIKISSLQRDVNIFKDFSVFFELIRIFRKEKPDVVHLNSTKIGGVGVVAGRITHVPKIIFTAHGWAFNEKRNAISKLAIAFLQWLTVRLSHTTIAVSQKTASQILAFPFISKKKIKVIYNGAADIDFVDRDEARRALLTNIPINTPHQALEQSTWIGTISELHSNKGIDVAITAFAKIAKKYPQTIFIIIGDGEEKTNLENQIAKLGLTSQVFLINFVTDAKKYLKAFDIFTLTSRTEALPYVILEAGLAELPVVASNVGGIPEIINSPETGLLVPTGEKAPEAIRNALEKLITNKDFAKILGQNLRKRVREQFSQQKMLSETFSVY